MPAPSLAEFETAAAAVGNMNANPGGGLKALTVNGKPLTLDTANGAVAAAYVDTSGNVIIAYQGTETQAQFNADLAMVADAPAASIGALTDALNFVTTVKAAAGAAGLNQSNISVTGFSLGGNLAEYVAMKTGLPGMSFAGSGLPSYLAPSTPAQNFISFVETGDPWANRASDTALAPLVSGQDHYGRVEIIGSQAATSLTTGLLNDVKNLVPALFDGQESAALGRLVTDYATAFNTRHVMSNYFADINALPAADVSLGTLVTKAASSTDMLANFSPVPTTSSAAAPATVPHTASTLGGLIATLSTPIVVPPVKT